MIKKTSKRREVKASNTKLVRRASRIVADDELDAQMTPVEQDAGEVNVDPAATELLFETDDVAQLVAEVAGQDVNVTVDDETGETVFAVGEHHCHRCIQNLVRCHRHKLVHSVAVDVENFKAGICRRIKRCRNSVRVAYNRKGFFRLI